MKSLRRTIHILQTERSILSAITFNKPFPSLISPWTPDPRFDSTFDTISGLTSSDMSQFDWMSWLSRYSYHIRSWCQPKKAKQRYQSTYIHSYQSPLTGQTSIINTALRKLFTTRYSILAAHCTQYYPIIAFHASKYVSLFHYIDEAWPSFLTASIQNYQIRQIPISQHILSKCTEKNHYV